jgi:hypothetical protein
VVILSAPFAHPLAAVTATELCLSGWVVRAVRRGPHQWSITRAVNLDRSGSMGRCAGWSGLIHAREEHQSELKPCGHLSSAIESAGRLQLISVG